MDFSQSTGNQASATVSVYCGLYNTDACFTIHASYLYMYLLVVT